MTNNPYLKSIHEHKDTIYTFEDEISQNWQEVFGNEHACVVDIGCGAGNFLRDSAALQPEYNFIGFELRYKRLVKATLKFKKKGVENIRLVQRKGETVHEWFKPGSLQRLHVNFPDPWAKSKQLKHRLLSEEFFRDIHPLFNSEGEFWFKTDHQEYFLSTAELIRNLPDYKLISYTEDLHRSEFNELNVLTEFEQLFKNQKLPIYFLRAIPIGND